MRANLFAALLTLASTAPGWAAVFYHDESVAGELSHEYLLPTVFTPGAGSLALLNYTTDAENPENLSYLMSQPRATLSAPPSNDFAEPIGYVGFGEWAVGRNVLRVITAGPPYDYAATLGPGSYAFWINETGPVSGYEFQFNVAAVPEPSALWLTLIGLPAVFLRRRVHA
jgi:hypothetical protein